MSLLDRLPHTCTAYKLTHTKDGMGGDIETNGTALFTDKACWQQVASDNTITRWKQRDIDITHNVFFNEDPGLNENCILVIGGWTHEVKSSSEPDYSWGLGIIWRVVTQRISRYVA